MPGKLIKENLKNIEKNIADCLEKSHRAAGDVKLLAVTKRHSESKIIECVEAGLVDLGENYLQEALTKMEHMQLPQLRWHFIGSVQSKKVKSMLGKFYLWHGVDRISVLQEISKRNDSAPQDVLLQVNIAGEDSKSGIKPDDLFDFFQESKELNGFRLCGLMTMPPLVESEEKSRFYFSQMKKLLEKCQKYVDIEEHPMNELSMGTSQDYTWAIEEGATIVRLGEVLVGPREQ